jgi:predicted Zn-dependent protease
MAIAKQLGTGLVTGLFGVCFYFSGPTGIPMAYAQFGQEMGGGSSMGARGGSIESSASANGVRSTMVKPLKIANELIKEQKFQEALVKLQNMDDSTRGRLSDKVPTGRSSYEEYALQKTRAIAAMGAGDLPLAAKSFEAVIRTGRLPTKDRLSLIDTMVSLYYQDKNYGNAIEWAQRHLAEGGTSANVLTLMANAYYLTGDFSTAKNELGKRLSENEAAGQVPTEELLTMLADSCLRLNDQGCHDATVRKLAAHYPKK